MSAVCCMIFLGDPLYRLICNYNSADEFEDAVVEDDPVEDVENNEPEKHKGNQMYITVLEAREHLYKLCKNENELILHLFGAFGGRNIDAPSKSLPVEGLFIDVLPVPPSRFRPVSSLCFSVMAL